VGVPNLCEHHTQPDGLSHPPLNPLPSSEGREFQPEREKDCTRSENTLSSLHSHSMINGIGRFRAVSLVACLVISTAITASAQEKLDVYQFKHPEYWTKERISQATVDELSFAGLEFMEGRDAPHLPDLAVKLFEAAFAKDRGDAFVTGTYYERIFNNPVGAMRWFARGANAGDIMSYIGLANMLEFNKESYRGYSTALPILRESESYLSAELAGKFYHKGLGTPAFPLEAEFYYRHAIELGSRRAMTGLGELFEAGLLDSSDPKTEAGTWYFAAARLGDENALSKQEALKLHMTPSQITRADALARHIVNRIGPLVRQTAEEERRERDRVR